MRCGSCGAGEHYLEEVEEGVEFYCRDCGTYLETADCLSHEEQAEREITEDIASLLEAVDRDEACWIEEHDAAMLDREAQASGVVQTHFLI